MPEAAQTPTLSDCRAVLATAAKALERDDDWEPVDYFRLLSDLDELGLAGQRQTIVIRRLLREIKPGDYCGYRPPQTSYEPNCQGLPMFAFDWDSESLGQRVYMKFCMAADGRLILVSLHRDRNCDDVR